MLFPRAAPLGWRRLIERHLESSALVAVADGLVEDGERRLLLRCTTLEGTPEWSDILPLRRHIRHGLSIERSSLAETVSDSEPSELKQARYGRTLTCMATVTVKSTYSLDVETVRQLEELAKRWNTSKSGALRRAIQSAANQVRSDHHEALDALDRLQSLLALDRESARAWADEVRQERRAAAERSAPWPSE